MSRNTPLTLLNQLKRMEMAASAQASEQRQFRRFFCRADAELHPMDTAQVVRTPLEIKIRDISRGGMGFISQTLLAPASCWRACFLHRGCVIAQQSLIIRHCRSVGAGLYLAGAQFCIDTGVLSLVGIDPARISEGNNPQDDESFLSPQDVD